MSDSVAIVANGFADGPAQALRDYLVERGTRLVTILHPLTPEQGTKHDLTEYVRGRPVRERSVDLGLRAPLSFAADPFVPLPPPRVDVWFGFNPLACATGLVARRARRVRRVVLWSVDFVPDRFGPGTLLTRLYDRLDRRCCLHADARVELSAAARGARNRRHRVDERLVPIHVVPMGAWVDRVPTVPLEAFSRRRVVFLGHLVPRQGVPALLEAVALLRGRGEPVSLDVVGGGPQKPELEQRADALAIGDAVRFHGFVPQAVEVERLLAQASIAAAPYVPSETNFTRFADPGKLKAYLAAGLPTVLTDVPPNADELAREAGAEIVPYDAGAIAETIARALSSSDAWQARRRAALAYARRFDWSSLLSDLLTKLAIAT